MQCARAVLQQRTKQSLGLSTWLAQLTSRTHRKIAAAASANKLARIAWAVLAKNEPYRPPCRPMPRSAMPANKLYAAGKAEPFVNVALRVPTFSLNTPEKRSAFVTTMTDAIEQAAAGRLERTESISTGSMVMDSGALEAKPIPTKNCSKSLRRQVQRKLKQPDFSRPFQSISLLPKVLKRRRRRA